MHMKYIYIHDITQNIDVLNDKRHRKYKQLPNERSNTSSSVPTNGSAMSIAKKRQLQTFQINIKRIVLLSGRPIQLIVGRALSVFLPNHPCFLYKLYDEYVKYIGVRKSDQEFTTSQQGKLKYK